MLYKKINYLSFDSKVKVTKNNAQCPLHHVTLVSAPAQYEDALSKGLGGDAFTRKYII